MQGFLKSVIYTVHHPVHVYNILVSAIFFFFVFFHSFIGCSSSDIQYKFVIQHTHTHTHTKKQKNNSLALRMVLKGTSTTSSPHYRFSSCLN